MLKLTNESGVTFTAIDVSIEALEADTPHEHVERIAFLADRSSALVDLLSGPARVMVTWRDPDDVLWRRHHVGGEYELERLN